MKYKLINQTTKEETLCDKVTIDGFDYYVSDNPKGGKYIIWLGKTVEHFPKQGTPQLTYGTTIISTLYSGGHAKDWKEIVATNNPNIDVPKVVDELMYKWNLGLEVAEKSKTKNKSAMRNGFVKGYNKSQETHPNSDDDMVEFVDFVEKSMCNDEGYTQFKTNKELLQIWKEQKPKIVYYGND